MSNYLKSVILSVVLFSLPGHAIGFECRTWLLKNPLAVADVGSPRHTLVLTREGVLEFHDAETGEPLRDPIALGPDILRDRFAPTNAIFSDDGSLVTVYYGDRPRTFYTASGLQIGDRG